MIKKNEYVISSAYDFLKLINESNRKEWWQEGILSFYRGQANSNWGLTPKLYRPNEYGERTANDMVDYEERLVDEFRYRCPELFETLNTFDMLALMQHYGLPTRLLDITQNPLVALYFACVDKKQLEFSGEIAHIRIINEGTWSPNEASKIARFLLWCARNNMVNKSLASIFNKFCGSFNVDPDFCELVRRYLFKEHPNFIVAFPSRLGERIKRQEGAFIIVPNVIERDSDYKPYSIDDMFGHWHEIDKIAKNYIYCDRLYDLKTLEKTNHIDIDFYTVHPKSKIQILKELDTLRSTRSHLFPEPEYIAEDIYKSFIRRHGQIDEIDYFI